MEDMTKNTQKQSGDVAIVVVPFPAQGHLNQLLHFSTVISSYNLPVHFVSSTVHTRQAKLRANAISHSDTANIHFHEFPIPAFSSPPPDFTADNRFPSHLRPGVEASASLQEPVTALLHEIALTVRRLVLVHDPLISIVVQDIYTIPNAETYVFNCLSAFTHFFEEYEMKGKLFELEMELEVPSLDGCLSAEMWEFAFSNLELMEDKAGDIHNTSRLIEGPYIDLLERIGGYKKQWAIGPLVPTTIKSNCRHKCLEWLDERQPNSVIYVSFGTTTSMMDEEIIELAAGLEKSGANFLWVLRDADRANIFEGEVTKFELPKGYEERIRGVGMVIRDWAPQPEILAHKSIAGFVSHCGWNSCSEALTYGVPILTMPMHSDQPRNAVLITDVLKVGIVMKDWGQYKEVVRSSVVEQSIRKLMESEAGKEVQKRSKELGRALAEAKGEGGMSRVEMDSFIAHITR